MLEALRALDRLMEKNDAPDVLLIVGGGGAMALAHGIQLVTSDIDAVPKGMELETLDKLVKETAAVNGLPPDWLNPYYATYTHVLPADYGERLVEVFRGARLTAKALGLDDMLIMKCFAGRLKDKKHAKELLLKGASAKKVEAHIEALARKNIPGATKALDFLDEVRDEVQA